MFNFQNYRQCVIYSRMQRRSRFRKASVSRPLLLSARDIALFSLLARYRFLRANFIHAFLGGDRQHLIDRLRLLWDHGYLDRPVAQWETIHALCRPIIYENTDRAEQTLRQHGAAVASNAPVQTFKHSLLVSDLVSSFELSARQFGIAFLPSDTLGITSLQLPCAISHTFRNGKIYRSARGLVPDALFGLRGTKTIWFALEADRGTEPIDRGNLQQTSYLQKILSYRDVISKRTYEHHWRINDLLVLNVITKIGRVRTVLKYLDEELNQSPRSMLFKELPSLVGLDKSPTPLTSILDEPWERAGHEAVSIARVLAH